MNLTEVLKLVYADHNPTKAGRLAVVFEHIVDGEVAHESFSIDNVVIRNGFIVLQSID